MTFPKGISLSNDETGLAGLGLLFNTNDEFEGATGPEKMRYDGCMGDLGLWDRVMIMALFTDISRCG